MSHACECGVSERHACLLLGQPRGTQRYRLTQFEDEDCPTQAVVALASQYGCYGYRRLTALMRADWKVGKDRDECIWSCEGAEGSEEAKAAWKPVAER